MQLGFSHTNKHHISITSYLCDHLSNFELLTQSVATLPTCLAKVMPNYPSIIGSVNATKSGMGGVLFVEEHIICAAPSRHTDASPAIVR